MDPNSVLLLLLSCSMFCCSGDTRALLVKTGQDGVLTVTQLSDDHTLDDPQEQRRLSALGLDVEKLKTAQKIGNSSCTRCIGDYHVKGGYRDIDYLRYIWSLSRIMHLLNAGFLTPYTVYIWLNSQLSHRLDGCCLVLLWLTELSGFVLSCFMLSHETIFAEVSCIKPEGFAHMTVQGNCFSRSWSWVRKLFSVMGQKTCHKENDWMYLVVVTNISLFFGFLSNIILLLLSWCLICISKGLALIWPVQVTGCRKSAGNEKWSFITKKGLMCHIHYSAQACFVYI